MSNSPLVKYTKLSPNHSGLRTQAISRITPHCVVGQLTAEGICDCFPSGRDASCNYGIGTDGKVCLCVQEKNRSWCSSSADNDQKAVTIECASDLTYPYAMNSEVYKLLIDLCVDICKRNGKKKLLWLGNKTKTLSYNPKQDEMVLTAHRWFWNTECPGDWLYARLGDLAKEVTKRLGGTVTSDKKTEFTPYKVKVIVDMLNIRKGAGTNYDKTGAIRDMGIYTIVAESTGKGATKWGKLKSGLGWIALDYTKRV